MYLKNTKIRKSKQYRSQNRFPLPSISTNCNKQLYASIIHNMQQLQMQNTKEQKKIDHKTVLLSSIYLNCNKQLYASMQQLQMQNTKEQKKIDHKTVLLSSIYLNCNKQL